MENFPPVGSGSNDTLNPRDRPGSDDKASCSQLSLLVRLDRLCQQSTYATYLLTGRCGVLNEELRLRSHWISAIAHSSASWPTPHSQPNSLPSSYVHAKRTRRCPRCRMTDLFPSPSSAPSSHAPGGPVRYGLQKVCSRTREKLTFHGKQRACLLRVIMRRLFKLRTRTIGLDHNCTFSKAHNSHDNALR